MDAVARLREVSLLGGPAQAEEARRLLALVDNGAGVESVDEQIAQLYDAYLNDPYLTRD
jgi:hypothetical protein